MDNVLATAIEQNKALGQIYNEVTDKFMGFLRTYYDERLTPESDKTVDNNSLSELQDNINNLFQEYKLICKDEKQPYGIVFNKDRIKFVAYDIRTRILFEGLLKGVV